MLLRRVQCSSGWRRWCVRWWKKTEDVGERFAEEARRIHYNEVPAHGMPGIASAEQREELAEEGIDVFQLPIALPDKQSLQ